MSDKKAPDGKLYGYIFCPKCGIALHKDKELDQKYCAYAPHCLINPDATLPPEDKGDSDVDDQRSG